MALTIIFQISNGKTEDKIQHCTERSISGREGDHSHLKAKGEAQLSGREGDHSHSKAKGEAQSSMITSPHGWVAVTCKL